ncbi:MAG: DNA-3-methyladenine glycosylase 2 family protein [Oscillospiraceae bacterium]|nr:DNA-3-methyladenine glycosylase 2 family protein [Oscillospiraceae bacterium]
MFYKCIGPDLLVTLDDCFDLAVTLQCGQCFRFFPFGQGFRGVGLDHGLTVFQQDENTLLFQNTTPQQFEEIWMDYFDLKRDYKALRQRMSCYPCLAAAADFAPGLRVLNQGRWEALATFILSQNNNIPRITGIVQRLCRTFGEPLGDELYTFPSAQTLAGLTLEDLAPLRAGFRAKYLLDAAKRVADGSLDLEKTALMDTDKAAEQLCVIHGVGPKVARCALLYGFGHSDALPVDVWIRRVLDCHFPHGFPAELADCAGLIQQFLFEYARHCPGALDPQEA